MLNVLLNHLRGDIAHADGEVAASPKVLSPVPLPKLGKLHLELAGGLALQELHEVADREAGINGDEDVDMIGGDCSREDLHILFDTDAADELLGALTNRPLEDFEAVFGYPGEMQLEAEDAMGGFAILGGHMLPVYWKLSPEGEGKHPAQIGAF